MGTSLTGLKIKDSYSGLLKTSDNGALGASAKLITDGLGNSSGVYLGTSGNVGIGASPSTPLSGEIITEITGTNYGSLKLNSSTVRGLLRANEFTTTLYAGTTSNHSFALVTNDTEAMRIDSSGNVGIGTNNPLSQLHIRNTSQNSSITDTVPFWWGGLIERAVVGGSNAAFGIVGGAKSVGSGGYLFLGYSDNVDDNYVGIEGQDMRFGVNGLERMRIDSSGNVLINKQSFSNAGAGVILRSDATSGGNIRLTREDNTSTQTHISFYTNSGSTIGSITTTTSSTAYNTSSDYRLKEDWKPMSDALTRIDALKPVNFAWKSDGKRVDGFLAHELQKVIPEAVTGEKDAMRDEEYEVSPAVYEEVVHPAEEAVYETIEHPAIAEELDADGNIIVEAQEAYTEEVLVSEAKEEWTEKVLVSEAVMGTRSVPDYQGIDQSKIVPLLTAGLQEAHEMIKQLEARIAALEAR